MRFKVVFSLTVSSTCTLTLWICILRLSISALRSPIAFLLTSILILNELWVTCASSQPFPSHPGARNIWTKCWRFHHLGAGNHARDLWARRALSWGQLWRRLCAGIQFATTDRLLPSFYTSSNRILFRN